jgi:hypothetical protein
MFALACVYMTMIIRPWGRTDQAVDEATDTGVVTGCVNMGASWVILPLYAWP